MAALSLNTDGGDDLPALRSAIAHCESVIVLHDAFDFINLCCVWEGAG